MRKLLVSIASSLVVLSVALMTGCGPIYQTTYAYVPPKSKHGQRCVRRCLNQKTMCENNARVLNQACRMEANASAEPAYRDYLRRERKLNRTPWRTLGDFADYSACGNSENCTVDYRQCFTSCGGQVIPHTVCTAFCDKATPNP